MTGELVPANGRGRPSAFTPQVQEIICAGLRAGCYLETAAKLAGVHRSTLFRWLKRGADGEPGFAEFYDAVRKAEAEAEIEALALIRKAAETDWRAGAWFLARRFPQRWGGGERETGEMEKMLEDGSNGGAFDPDRLTTEELREYLRLGRELQALHKKGLPADTNEAEFTVLPEKGIPEGETK